MNRRTDKLYWVFMWRWSLHKWRSKEVIGAEEAFPCLLDKGNNNLRKIEKEKGVWAKGGKWWRSNSEYRISLTIVLCCRLFCCLHWVRSMLSERRIYFLCWGRTGVTLAAFSSSLPSTQIIFMSKRHILGWHSGFPSANRSHGLQITLSPEEWKGSHLVEKSRGNKYRLSFSGLEGNKKFNSISHIWISLGNV